MGRFLGGNPPLIRYIRNVWGISKLGHILGKVVEALEERIPAFSKELENNLGIYFCLFFLISLCCPLAYSVDIL